MWPRPEPRASRGGGTPDAYTVLWELRDSWLPAAPWTDRGDRQQIVCLPVTRYIRSTGEQAVARETICVLPREFHLERYAFPRHLSADQARRSACLFLFPRICEGCQRKSVIALFSKSFGVRPFSSPSLLLDSLFKSNSSTLVSLRYIRHT